MNKRQMGKVESPPEARITDPVSVKDEELIICPLDRASQRETMEVDPYQMNFDESVPSSARPTKKVARLPPPLPPEELKK